MFCSDILVMHVFAVRAINTYRYNKGDWACPVHIERVIHTCFELLVTGVQNHSWKQAGRLKVTLFSRLKVKP